MFVDTAYFIFYKTNKNVLKKDLDSRLWRLFKHCWNWVLSYSVASLTQFDTCKNKLAGKAFLPSRVGFWEDSDHLDGTISFSLIQKKPLGDPLWLTSADVFLARHE